MPEKNKFSEYYNKITKSRLFWPIMGLVLVLLFNLIRDHSFYSITIIEGRLFGPIIDIINRAGPLMILAIGMTFVIATGGTDISVGSVCAISGSICASLVGGNFSGETKNPYFLAILVAIVICTALGTWNGFLVSKLKIQPIVATLILMVAGRGIAQLIVQGQIITVYYKPYAYLGAFIPGSLFPTAIYIVIVFGALALLAVKKTSFGLFLQSTGINATASKLTGITVSRLIFFCYTFSAFCAAVAGVMLSSQIKAADANNIGLFIEMDAILSVALGGNSLNGGKFSLGGSIVGALTIQSLTTTMYAVGVTAQQLPFIKAVVVIIICTIQTEEFRKLFMKLFNKDRWVKNEKQLVNS